MLDLALDKQNNVCFKFYKNYPNQLKVTLVLLEPCFQLKISTLKKLIFSCYAHAHVTDTQLPGN